MDTDVARWIVEFILRQPIEGRTLNALLRVLPFPNATSDLKKVTLLRRIESEISNGSVSEKILELLEAIEELCYEDGISASEAMKKAYCAVAVDCTVRVLDESEDKEGKYFDAVQRIWRGKAWKMERSERAGLLSDELRYWGEEIEAAVWNASVSANLPVKNRESDAVEAVRAYVVEAWGGMGPSFLDLVTGTVGDDGALRQLLRLTNGQVCDQVGERAARGRIVGNEKKEMQKGVVLPMQKHIVVKCSRIIAGTSRGVKITDSEELDSRSSSSNYDCLCTLETAKVLEALRTSSSELQALVKDPLPDALHLSESILASLRRKNTNQEPSAGKSAVSLNAASPIGGHAEDAPINDFNFNNQGCRNVSNVPKSSLMERNSTACTYEWNDSIDGSPEGLPDHGHRFHFPTPNGRVVSPLKKYEITKLGRRRKARKWSKLEEDTLRTGIQKIKKQVIP
ncbi:uncharacterized protein LOC127796588 isoform X2 [Diospyros lotus]|uniref:uncharacterized protein LOC127796588 isoform X2 n=1 Tax=Diospyros lotus TaxID=55363 RepID=UPI00224DB048|nr:uncharacterized protein LOC127796588 isoform X2 [Diospyros lotus]